MVIIDTAGRLHTKVNLMEELKKVKRVIAAIPGAPMKFFSLDATPDRIHNQAKMFNEP